jgi:hypothetical protein
MTQRLYRIAAEAENVCYRGGMQILRNSPKGTRAGVFRSLAGIVQPPDPGHAIAKS